MAPNDRRVLLASYGITLARGVAGAGLLALVVATLVLPVGGIGRDGNPVGAAVGCLLAAAVTGAVLIWVHRCPTVPAAHALTAMSEQLSCLYLFSVAALPAVLTRPDSTTALVLGAVAGCVLVAISWLAARRFLH